MEIPKGRKPTAATYTPEGEEVETVPTGSLSIDLALGIGGLPRGHLVEVFGPESSGKTTFCLTVIAQIQRHGGHAAFIDVEHVLDAKYAQQVGVKLRNLLISQPDSGEDALNIAEKLIRSNLIDVVVIDSVAALVPKQEIEGQFGKTAAGAQARFIAQPLQRLAEAIRGTRCVCLLTNQVREEISFVRDNPTGASMIPAVRAVGALASVRLDMRHLGKVKNLAHQDIGTRTGVKIVKNEVAQTRGECELDIVFGEGISRAGEIVDLGLRFGVLQKSAGWYLYNGERIGMGRENVRNVLARNPQLAQELEKRVLASIMPHSVRA